MPNLPEPWLQMYQERKLAIKMRLQDFSKVSEENYFYELLFCLLTPQSSAKNAELTISDLKAARFLEKGFDPVAYLRDPKHYIRFHNVKGKRLLYVRTIYPTLQPILIGNRGDVLKLRSIVMKHVPGLGLKESSHFLRNIGIRGLAILDRHILKHLRHLAIIEEIPKSMTPKAYLGIEKEWLKYSETVGISLDELDLLFWSMETGVIRK